MKKKLTTTLFAVFCLLLLNGCTLRFKAEKMEVDTKPPEAKIGNNLPNNNTYELVAMDILKK